MSNPRYPEEFKIQAVNQVTEKKLPVAKSMTICARR
jgi:transposase